MGNRAEEANEAADGGAAPGSTTVGDTAGAGTTPDSTTRRRGRRLAIATAPLLVAAAVAAIVLGTGSPSPHLARNAGSSAATMATVERRDLVETDTESGILSYASPQTVYDRLGGTITWLPAIGQTIRRGQTLFEVDNKPVILLYGSKPAYRDLDSSDRSGPDVGELNANLVSLGYDAGGIVLDETWQAATTAGVKELQAALGEKQTGKIALGRVVFLPGEQLVDAIDGTIGSPTSYASRDATKAELVDLASTEQATSTTSATSTATGTTPTTSTITRTVTVTASTSTTAGERRAGGGQKSGGAADGSGGGQKSGGAASSGGGKKSGGGAGGNGSGGSGANGGGSAILQTSSTRLVATVDLPAGSQSEAVVGAHVTVEMPNGSMVGGTIASVSPIAASGAGRGGAAGGNGGAGGAGEGANEGGAGSGSQATVPVTIRFDRRPGGAGLDQAPVSVDFARARARNVLSVPVTALVATSGAAYAVQEANAPHRLLPVTTGLFAAGYVQISGPGIRDGLRVTDSQG